MCLNKDSNFVSLCMETNTTRRLSPLRNDKKDMGYTVVIHNITETKAAEAGSAKSRLGLRERRTEQGTA